MIVLKRDKMKKKINKIRTTRKTTDNARNKSNKG